LALVAESCKKGFADQIGLKKGEVDVWKKIEAEIIGPAKSRLKDEIRSVAKERSKELVIIMANAAVDCIGENFELVGTVGRTLFSFTRLCDSAAESLNKKINTAVQARLLESGFNDNLGAVAQRLITNALMALQYALGEINNATADSSKESVRVDPGKPVYGAGDIFNDALGTAMKGVVANMLKALTAKLEEKAATEVAEKGAKQAVKKALEKGAEEVGKQALKKSVVATGAKALGVITLVLIPFDIQKMADDFKKGRETLQAQVRARYDADRTLYELRIFDFVWARADDALNEVLRDVRTNRDNIKSVQENLVTRFQDAKESETQLQDLAERFKARVNE